MTDRIDAAAVRAYLLSLGLQSGGRAESILMSFPPLVRWRYD